MPQFSPTNYEGRDRLAHIEDYLQNKIETPDRAQLALNARGLVGETFPLAAAATTGGTQSAVSLVHTTIAGFRAGDVITNVLCLLTSEGGTLTDAAVGVWDSSGTLLAKSGGNSSTAFSTTSVAGTIVVSPLSSPYTIAVDGGYYLGFVSTGNIGPKLASGSAVTGVGKQAGSGARFSTRATGQTGAATFTPTDSATAFWFAAS